MDVGPTRPKCRIEPSLYVAPLALLALSMAELSSPLTSQARFRVEHYSSDASVDQAAVNVLGKNCRTNEHDCRRASFPEVVAKVRLGDSGHLVAGM